MYKIIFLPEAIIDMQNAYEWYEKQKTGLGYAFLEEVNICIHKLCYHPEYYSYINHIYRRIKTNHFPYLVIYEIENNTIFVNSVKHGMSNLKF